MNLEESASGEKEGRELKYLDLEKKFQKMGANPFVRLTASFSSTATTPSPLLISPWPHHPLTGKHLHFVYYNYWLDTSFLAALAALYVPTYVTEWVYNLLIN